jgi:hypothetical protein
MGCQDGVVEICYFPITRTKDVRDMGRPDWLRGRR